jgi:hypothetical protein
LSRPCRIELDMKTIAVNLLVAVFSRAKRWRWTLRGGACQLGTGESRAA